jgi:transcriptional regulator with XRE-family HTH domain
MSVTKSSMNTAKLRRLRSYVESFCGIYSRVARRLGVDRTYVSRVAKGERRSPTVEAALIQDFESTEQEIG